ncbi:PQQ-like beta-propeller repeat protein [Pyruvatibacter sp. HU-CL02332]|uniref:PQQ-like beta-propeller repeat protein n=1 Tax=Pyruvatibacter sp. HU-CL02332 TaxID=3127650 RepID=UPI00296869E5|nr:PQQ-binding-like beta-propeller repeat protein [Alphaproteobacteria bacterium]
MTSQFHIFSRTTSRVAALSALAFTLVACDTVNDLISPSDDPPLPGERISVMSLEQQLEADPRIAGLQVVLPAPYVNTDWAQPGGFPDNVLHHLDAPEAISEVWDADAGQGSSSNGRLTAPPIIADGRAFVLDAEGGVRAFEADTGTRIWAVDLTPEDADSEEGFGGGIAYDDGAIYVATGFGTVVAMDAATGEEFWTYEGRTPFRAAPSAVGGRIFVISFDNQTSALAQATGEVLWTHQGIQETAGILGSPSPAVSGDTLVVPYSSGEVFALRVENGQEVWNDTLTRTLSNTALANISDIAGRPVIDRDRVFAVSHAGRMVAIDIRTGERVWTRSLSGVQTPWVAGDFIFLVTTSAEVIALSRRDGRIRWVTQLPRFTDPEDRDGPITWAGPVLAGDRLLLASSTGEAFAVSPYNGDVLGEVEIPRGTFISPIVANKTVYILTDAAELLAFR